MQPLIITVVRDVSSYQEEKAKNLEAGASGSISSFFILIKYMLKTNLASTFVYLKMEIKLSLRP